MITPEAEDEWHSMPLEELTARLDTTAGGLPGGEARDRLRRFGPNSLRPAKPVSAWKILIDQFRSVVVLLLLAAAVLAWIFGDPHESIAVFAVLAINAALGFGTEFRARGAMAALLRLEVPTATVLRDGHALHLPASGLVPGDLILVEAGKSIPADARLISAAELQTTEAALTGESLPVDKKAGALLPHQTPLAERANMLYMSTAVAAGSGKALVVATGMATEVGRIGVLTGQIREARTPLEQRLDALGRRLIGVTLAVTAVVVGLGWMRGEPIARMIETGIALAVAAVPEGLPAIATIALAVGVARMARRNALVRRLAAVESLGSATTVCTDKTGTLTAGQMTVTDVWAGGRSFRVTGTGYQPQGAFTEGGRVVELPDAPPLELALRIGALANRASLTMEGEIVQVHGDPTEAALVVAGRKGGLEREELLRRWPETGEIPFSSDRMLMATFHGGPEAMVVHVKGAPSRVLERSRYLLTEEGQVELGPDTRERVLDRNRRMAARGLRVLGLATGRPVQPTDDGPQDLTFVGLVGMIDPAAPGVPETIDRFREAGIRTVMITGDQAQTAEAVARELGILGADDEVLGWQDLQGLSGEELSLRLAKVAVLSRVTSADKLRIVEAFQRRGEIVAMLGDGANDAPALKKADIGVAMGTRGTDIAKEAAAVVLRDDRFQTIGVAVEEGRVIFDNIRKFVFYLFSCNLAEVLVILGATLLGLPLPLLPLQILWLNLVTDTFPALSLAVEPGGKNVMQRPPFQPERAILSAGFIRVIVYYALLITAVTLGAFAWSLGDATIGTDHAMTIAFMTLALAQIFHLGNARDTEPVLKWERATANRWALAAVALALGLQLFAVYFPPLGGLLGVVPLAARDWLVIVPLALIPALVGQVVAWRGTLHRKSVDLERPARERRGAAEPPPGS